MATEAVPAPETQCTVCGKLFPAPEQFTETETPLFSEATAHGDRVEGWNFRVRACQSCTERLGKPTKVLSRPYQNHLALFEKTKDPVVLLGSGPND